MPANSPGSLRHHSRPCNYGWLALQSKRLVAAAARSSAGKKPSASSAAAARARYGRPSPREATEALVRVLDAFEAAPRVLDVGNSVIVPSTDDIALKMEERQDIDLCRSNDWSQYLRGGLAARVPCVRGGAGRGAALPVLPDAVAAAGERGLVPGPQREADVRRRRDLSAEATVPARVAARVRTWGRYRYMAAGGARRRVRWSRPSAWASGSSACRCLPGTSGPGARRPVLPVLEAHGVVLWPTTRSASRAPPTACTASGSASAESRTFRAVWQCGVLKLDKIKICSVGGVCSTA